MPETLYLTVNLIDRFLEAKQVTRKHLQLVGVTAMLVASKYEEIWAPEVRDFVYISDRAYTRDQILNMEKIMLNSLRFNLTVPSEPGVGGGGVAQGMGFDGRAGALLGWASPGGGVSCELCAHNLPHATLPPLLPQASTTSWAATSRRRAWRTTSERAGLSCAAPCRAAPAVVCRPCHTSGTAAARARLPRAPCAELCVRVRDVVWCREVTQLATYLVELSMVDYTTLQVSG